MTLSEIAAYLAGFVDGEGHIGCHRTKRGGWTRCIAISNTDMGLINTVTEMFKEVGISVNAYDTDGAKPKWSKKTTIYVSGGKNGFEKFRQLIPIQAAYKIEALRVLLDESYADPEDVKTKRRKGTYAPCKNCGNPVYGTVSARSRGDGYFCSTKCRATQQRRRITLICAVCSKPFEVKPARANGRKYCSNKCRGIALAPSLRARAKAAAKARWDKR